VAWAPSFQSFTRRNWPTQGNNTRVRIRAGDQRRRGRLESSSDQIGMDHNGIDARCRIGPPAPSNSQLEGRSAVEMIRPRRGTGKPTTFPHRSPASNRQWCNFLQATDGKIGSQLEGIDAALPVRQAAVVGRAITVGRRNSLVASLRRSRVKALITSSLHRDCSTGGRWSRRKNQQTWPRLP